MKKLKKFSSLTDKSLLTLNPLTNKEIIETLHSKKFFWNLKEKKEPMPKKYFKSIFPSGFFMNPVKMLTRSICTAMFYKKKQKLKLITDPNLFKILENQIDFLNYHDLDFKTSKIYKISYDVIKETIIVLCGLEFDELLKMKENEYDLKVIDQVKYKFKIYMKKNFNRNSDVSLGTKILFEFGETKVDEVFKEGESLGKYEFNQHNFVEYYVRYGYCKWDDLMRGLQVYRSDNNYPIKLFNLRRMELAMYCCDFNFFNNDDRII